LGQALKLLVLVHVGEDLSLDPGDDVAYAIARTWFPFFDTPLSTDPSSPSTCTPTEPTPCFIRGQFGAVMPALAERLMKDCLGRLEAMSLSRQCSVWPVIFATFAVLLMAVETVQYHGAKEGYHAMYDNHDNGYGGGYGRQTASAPVPIMRPGRSVADDVVGGTGDEEVDALLSFYKTCYSGCHSKLQDGEEPRCKSMLRGRSDSMMGLDDGSARFVEKVKSAMKESEEYLRRRSVEGRAKSGDMSSYFDRLLPKLLLLQA